MSRKDKADKPDKAGKAGKPPSGPLGPWRLALVVFAVAATSGAVLTQSVQTGVGVDLALGRALAVAVVLWILLGSIDRMLARPRSPGITTNTSRPSTATPPTPSRGPPLKSCEMQVSGGSRAATSG